MNFSDFITNHGKRVNMEHFIHLIQVSKTDGNITTSEMEMLHKEGRKFGLTDPEIDKLIESESQHYYLPPYSLQEKFEHLYNVAQMILSDEIIADGEKQLIKRFAIEAGFNDKAIDKLMEILFEGINNNKSEESLLAEFKSHLFKD